jgi:hypothetical protein
MPPGEAEGLRGDCVADSEASVCRHAADAVGVAFARTSGARLSSMEAGRPP